MDEDAITEHEVRLGLVTGHIKAVEREGEAVRVGDAEQGSKTRE